MSVRIRAFIPKIFQIPSVKLVKNKKAYNEHKIKQRASYNKIITRSNHSGVGGGQNPDNGWLFVLITTSLGIYYSNQ
jgi:hypothetical protein